MRDSNCCVGDSNRLSEIWILRQERFESITRRFKSLSSDLQSSVFLFAKGFESVSQRFESPSLVHQNFRYRDSNRCVGDSNRLSQIWILRHEGFESLWGDSNRLSEIWILRQEGFESVTQRFESLSSDLQSSAFIFVEGFKFVSRRFESPSLVHRNSRYRDLNRCVGDSNLSVSFLFMFFMRDSNR